VADSPGTTWDGLIGKLVLELHELACWLLQVRSAPSLSTRPTTFTVLIFPSTNNSAKSLLLHQSSSGDPACTLAVAQDQVATLRDLREVLELNPQGGHCAALAENLRKAMGQVAFQGLCKQPWITSHTATCPQVCHEGGRVRPWEAILASLDADPETALVAPAAALEAGRRPQS
jgi:hypothetical protein